MLVRITRAVSLLPLGGFGSVHRGDTPNLPDETADRLIAAGFAEPLDAEDQREAEAQETQESEDDDAGIVHVGGGTYELPDGRRVRGRDAAMKALTGEPDEDDQDDDTDLDDDLEED